MNSATKKGESQMFLETTRKQAALLAGATMVLVSLSGAANAGGLFERDSGSLKDAPVAEGRKFEWSVNGGLMTDYVFRGISNSNEDPAWFVGADASYGIFYAGVWAAQVDEFFTYSSAEVDLYAGITPKLGPISFDFGVLYYGYADQDELAAGVDNVGFWEFKAGVSTEIQKLSAGVTYYYSNDTFAEGGETHTVEGTLGYSLPTVWIFDPTIDGTIGHWSFEEIPGGDITYWNAGLSLAVEKLTFDFRYWDSDSDGFYVGPTGNELADERFVFTATVALP